MSNRKAHRRHPSFHRAERSVPDRLRRPQRSLAFEKALSRREERRASRITIKSEGNANE